MRRLCLAVAVSLVAFSAHAGGVVRPSRPREDRLWSSYRNTALTAAMGLGGYKLPARGFRVEAVHMAVSIVGGGGAGNTVITLTDGTNTCVATFTCVALQSTGPLRVAAVSGAGTGCNYAPTAAVTASVTTAGCTTTQVTPMFLDFLGSWN